MGRVVHTCACGLWTFGQSGGCCTPCISGRQLGEEYPHDWLCRKREELCTFYPKELVDVETSCPECGATDMTNDFNWDNRQAKLRCRDADCQGERPL